MRFCTLNIVEVIFALKQCDDCVNLGMSVKPEKMVFGDISHFSISFKIISKCIIYTYSG